MASHGCITFACFLLLQCAYIHAICHDETNCHIYMIGFMENAIANPRNASNILSLHIVNTGEHTTRVDYGTNDRKISSISLPARTIRVVDVAADFMVRDSTVSRSGIRVETGDGVLIYGVNGFNQTRKNSMDGFLSIPITPGATTFYAVTLSKMSQILLVGIHNDTLMNVTLNTNGTVKYNNEAYDNGGLIHGTLHEYDTVQIQCDNGYLTGTVIQSSRPVSVFSGNKREKLPSISTNMGHLVEQMPSVNSWGMYFAIMSPTESWYICKVVAATPFTTVNFTCSDNTSESVLLKETTRCHQTDLSERTCTLTATRPILVTLFIGSATSDPSMVVIPPAQEFENGVLSFYVPNTLTSFWLVFVTDVSVVNIDDEERTLAHVENITDKFKGVIRINTGIHNVSLSNNALRITGYIYGTKGKRALSYPLLQHMQDSRGRSLTTSEKRTTTTFKMPTAPEELNTSTDKLLTTSEKRTTSTVKMPTTFEEMTTSTNKPLTTFEKRTTITGKMPTSSAEMTTSTDKPLTTSEKRTATTVKMPSVSEEMNTPTEKLLTTSQKRITTTIKMPKTSAEMTTSTDKSLTTSQKRTTTVKMQTASEKMTTSTDKLLTTSQKRRRTTVKLPSTSDEMTTSNDKWLTTSEKRKGTTVKKPTSSEEMTTSTDKPLTTSEKRTMTTAKMPTSSAEMTTSTDKPLTTSEKRTATTVKMPSVSEEMNTPTEKLLTTSQKRITTTIKMPKTSAEMTTSTDKSLTTSQKRTTTVKMQTASEKMTTSTDKPLTTSEKRTMTTAKMSTASAEMTTSTDKWLTTSQKRTTIVKGPTASDEMTTSIVKIPTDSDEMTTSANKSLTTSEKRTTTVNIPTTSEKMTTESQSMITLFQYWSVSSNKTCRCCKHDRAHNRSSEELKQIIKTLRAELLINPRKTNRHMRSLTSVWDDRVSAKVVGYGAGTILIMLGVGLVILDITNIISMVKRIRHNLLYLSCRNKNLC